MNYFSLEWSWYEDYDPYLFSHESKTKEEFETDVKFLMKKYGEDYLKQEKHWAQAPRWIEFILDKFKELGYDRIIPESFNIWGSYIIDDDREDGNCSLKQVVGKRLFNKAVQYNKDFANNLR